MFRVSTFENVLEKATSNLLLEPDWNSIMQICDMIRQKDISPKTAIIGIRRKLFSLNPHVVIYTLQVLESVVKNCGKSVYQEIATKDFMADLKDVYKENSNDQIRQKILELIQIWSHAFRNDVRYSIVKDTYILMKLEGYNFPVLKETDAMFVTDSPPDWVDAEDCHNCKTTFTLVQRKHHCRCCGQVFCQKCSSKNSIIPKFGIEREVRVCDVCYDLNNKSAGTATPASHSATARKGIMAKRDASPYSDSDLEDYEHYDTIPSKGKKVVNNNDLRSTAKVASSLENSDLPLEYLNSPLSKQNQQPALKSEQEEREEMELALALSASEAEANLAKAAKNSKYSYLGVGTTPAQMNNTSESVKIQSSPKTSNNYYASIENDMENELARYLDRNYWENKQKQLLMRTAQENSFNFIPTGGNGLPTMPSAPDALTSTNSCPSPSPSSLSSFLPSQTTLQSYQTTGNSAAFGTIPCSITQAGGGRSEQNKPTDAAAQAQIQQQQQIEEFSSALQNGINIFVKRMQSNASRGRSIVNDSSVQTLFVTLSQLQPKLLEQIKLQEDRRNQLENMQDKISQIKDARAALNALREDYKERERQEADAFEQRKKQQMEEKLELMRKKKQEYLDYQRQITFQRLHEQQIFASTLPPPPAPSAGVSGTMYGGAATQPMLNYFPHPPQSGGGSHLGTTYAVPNSESIHKQQQFHQPLPPQPYVPTIQSAGGGNVNRWDGNRANYGNNDINFQTYPHNVNQPAASINYDNNMGGRHPLPNANINHHTALDQVAYQMPPPSYSMLHHPPASNDLAPTTISSDAASSYFNMQSMRASLQNPIVGGGIPNNNLYSNNPNVVQQQQYPQNISFPHQEAVTAGRNVTDLETQMVTKMQQQQLPQNQQTTPFTQMTSKTVTAADGRITFDASSTAKNDSQTSGGIQDNKEKLNTATEEEGLLISFD